MSNDKLSKTDCPSETMELPRPLFSVEDISQQGDTQTETLLENQKTLLSLQATLSTMEKKGEMAEMELRSKAREILIVVNGMEHLEQQTKILHDRCVSISKENRELQAGIVEEEEDARTALAKFNSYRNKMEAHRMAVLHAANQTEARKLLEEKRAFAKRLTEQKEELRGDLENPNGRMVQMAKREIDALKEKISVMRKAAADMRERLRKEFETHAEIRKDIEIQNRRYEAIVKRLHCQLIRAQAQYRQASEDIYHMERELAELKRQLESSAVSGQ